MLYAMDNCLDNNGKDYAVNNHYAIPPYEKPTLEVIELMIEGSFLGANSHADFQDRVPIDDEQLTDDFD